jgi:hypothetical protein
MKIWDMHSVQTKGAIRGTSDGEADVNGLVLSEKAYLLALRDYRPAQLVQLVAREGPELAAQALIGHFGSLSALNASGGRGLVAARSWSMAPKVIRSDEAEVPVHERYR